MALRNRISSVTRALRKVWARGGCDAARVTEAQRKGKAQRDTITDTAGTSPPPTFPGKFR
ncbi:MAG TPA: hypothetical protein VFW96_27955 [Thermomicrobiales bacterium]|nr:hypothetical protein [Thermomicrobiales bacterium]